MPENRPYTYYDHAISLCPHCFRRIEAKIVIEKNETWMHKWCPVHGRSRTLIAADASYWKRAREVFIKPPEMPLRFNTELRYGCPYDCGLCPEHMQHSCLTIVEITDRCNLQCAVCYANSGPDEKYKDRTVDEIEFMLNTIVANEGEPDVVQISGGEPTIHPQIFEILSAVKDRPIRHMMLNTNGLRIANEADFARKLAEFKPGFEIYLQFDSMEASPLILMRGRDLRDIHMRAIQNLNAADISTTLVVTVARGVNDGEVGRIIEFAASQPCIRGVTFQPVQFAGRSDNVESSRNRLTLTDVRQLILEQTDVFSESDIIPVPCNPDSLAMGYALKMGGEITPLTRYLKPEILLSGGKNTISFETDPKIREQVFKLFSTGNGPEDRAGCLSSLMCCLPQIAAPPEITYKNVFRVVIMSFMDAENFDIRAMKKSCVHIVQSDGTIVPFETYNLLYRENAKSLLLERQSEFDRWAGRES